MHSDLYRMWTETSSVPCAFVKVVDTADDHVHNWALSLKAEQKLNRQSNEWREQIELLVKDHISRVVVTLDDVLFRKGHYVAQHTFAQTYQNLNRVPLTMVTTYRERYGKREYAHFVIFRPETAAFLNAHSG